MIRRCEFELVYQAIQRSGVAKDIDVLLSPIGVGRKRRLHADVFLTGAVMVASKSYTMTLDNIHKALTQWIPRSLQVELGIRTRQRGASTPLSVRQVRYFFSALDEKLLVSDKPGPGVVPLEAPVVSPALQAIIDKLVESTLPAFMPDMFSLAWDSSGLRTWGAPRWSKTAKIEAKGVDDSYGNTAKALANVVARGKLPTHSFDAHARSGYRTKTYNNKSRHLFGYELFAGVAVPPVGEDPNSFPKLMMALRPAGGSVIEPSLEVIDRIITDGKVIDELICDRGFSYKRSSDWSDELFRRGIDQTQDIHPLDHSVRDYDGLRVIDGEVYCPSMPDNLTHIERPMRVKVGPLRKRASMEERRAHEDTVKAIDEFRSLIAERELYAFVKHADANDSARDQDKTRMMCPAGAGKVRCETCPFSLQLPKDWPLVVDPPAIETAPKGCRQRTVTIPGWVTSKLRQRHTWGTDPWIESYSRRTHIEGFFGNIRDASNQNISRGFCRVVGLVKTSLMVAFVVMAANLRILRQWAKRVQDFSDPLCVTYPEDQGFEELDWLAEVQLSFPMLGDHPPNLILV